MLQSFPVDQVSTAVTAAECGEHSDESLLEELRQLWQDYGRRGVRVRHLTGAKLNEWLGNKRQDYGAEMLKKYSDVLGISVTSLYRMRQFAEAFPDFEDWEAKHPAVSSWTKVRELLPKLRRPAAVEKPAAKTAEGDVKPGAERPVRRAVEAVRAAQMEVHGVGPLTPGSEDWTALSEAVRAMLEEVEACLGGAFSPVTGGGPTQQSSAAATTPNRKRKKDRAERPGPSATAGTPVEANPAAEGRPS